MTATAFTESINSNTPPPGSTVYLQAMWYDAKGDWHKAHSLVDSLHDETACWVHAYLHRKEGDAGNAGYWYRNAGEQFPAVSLQQEWEQIVKALL
jgi:hypothetical protein